MNKFIIATIILTPPYLPALPVHRVSFKEPRYTYDMTKVHHKRIRSVAEHKRLTENIIEANRLLDRIEMLVKRVFEPQSVKS